MTVQAPRLRVTVDMYHRMGELGLLGEDDRVELIEGDITMMTPIGRRHAACVDRLNRLLVRRCGDDAIVRVQSPIVLSDDTEPEPDLSVLRARDDFYASGHPQGADVLLVVEVADTSIDYDRRIKLPLYGRSGVAALWIVDLGRGAIDAYRLPRPDGYGERRTFARGETVTLAEPPLEVAVDDVLPD